MMNESDEPTAARRPRAVPADGGVVGERWEFGVGVQFGLLKTGYENGSIVE